MACYESNVIIYGSYCRLRFFCMNVGEMSWLMPSSDMSPKVGDMGDERKSMGDVGE